MRPEHELLEIVHQRAAALRKTRRARATVVLGALAIAIVGTAVVASGAIGDRDDAVVAGPAEADGGTEPGPIGQTKTAVGRLTIPAIDLDVTVEAGVSQAALTVGPGWYPESSPPGEVGNTAIAGHRATHGAPFNRLDELGPGDEIVITTADRSFTFQVRETLIVEPTAVQVVGPTFWPERWALGPTSTLTLTTEHPEGSGQERLVVAAQLASGPVRDASEGGVPSPGELAPA